MGSSTRLQRPPFAKVLALMGSRRIKRDRDSGPWRPIGTPAVLLLKVPAPAVSDAEIRNGVLAYIEKHMGTVDDHGFNGRRQQRRVSRLDA